MIVMQSSTPVIRWPSASHQPARMSQITLPIAEGAPASGRLTSVRPKGQKAKLAIFTACSPNGIVMIRMNITSAASRYAIAIQKPQRTSQMTLRISRMCPPYSPEPPAPG